MNDHYIPFNYVQLQVIIQWAMKVHVTRNNLTHLFSNASGMIQVFILIYHITQRATVKKVRDDIIHTKDKFWIFF